MKKEETKQLLLLVKNCLIDKWDKIEQNDPNPATNKWMAYKRIRNTIRDVLREIATSKGIDITQ